MLKGKTALITGSTSGIGLATARTLAQDGANVILDGFGDRAEIEKLRAGIEKDFGVKARYSAADMTKPTEIADMVRAGEKEFGAIDVLVNNAGIQHVANIEDFPIEKWDAIIAINLSSSFHTIRAVVRGMKSRKWGRIVNIASAHGLVASVQKVAYVAANGGITCNAICPGWVLTELIKQQIETRAKANNQSFDQAKVSLLSEKQPMLEFTKPESVGALAVFLCSDAAATITGSAYSIDGGWVAQ
jgi:3-hydroxybutyrate dehydrogenase